MTSTRKTATHSEARRTAGLTSNTRTTRDADAHAHGSKSRHEGTRHSTAKDLFRQFAHGAATRVGSPWSFLLAVAIILVWVVTGPIFHFSDTWQLVINTGTTIVTFLMVFLIQNTQNRDALAIHLKLDELIRAMAGARNQLVDLEDLTDDELERLRKEFASLRSETIIERIENVQKRRRKVVGESDA